MFIWDCLADIAKIFTPDDHSSMRCERERKIGEEQAITWRVARSTIDALERTDLQIL
jgi:hypothetical protein